MEELLAADLGEVRLHGGPLARAACRLLGAAAVTFGRRILVSPAASRLLACTSHGDAPAQQEPPGSRRPAAGDRRALALAAHEAVHVLQYRRDGFLPMLVRYVGEYLGGRLRGLDHGAAYRAVSYEREAFAVEAQVLRGGASRILPP